MDQKPIKKSKKQHCHIWTFGKTKTTECCSICGLIREKIILSEDYWIYKFPKPNNTSTDPSVDKSA